MRILLSGGGTGGHVYPVLTVVESARAQTENQGKEALRFLYLGGKESIEEQLCQRYRLPFQAIPVGQIRGTSPLTMARNGALLAAGVIGCLRALSAFRPQVAFVTGGYVSAPVIIASWLRRCPVLIYLPDIEPGLAVRTLARFVRWVAVSFAESAPYFPPGKAVVTGYPVRAELYRVDREEARRRLGLLADAPVLLVMGGSRGAQSINRACAENLASLLAQAQIIHLGGAVDIAELQAKRNQLAPGLQARYHLYPYLHEEMVEALAAADLVVARAGAATLAEFPAVGLPAILVPYPYSGQHQEANADYMAQYGAARKVEDGRLMEQLLPLVDELLHSRETLREMSENARRLARPDAAQNIAALLRQLATGENASTPGGVLHR